MRGVTTGAGSSGACATGGSTATGACATGAGAGARRCGAGAGRAFTAGASTTTVRGARCATDAGSGMISGAGGTRAGLATCTAGGFCAGAASCTAGGAGAAVLGAMAFSPGPGRRSTVGRMFTANDITRATTPRTRNAVRTLNTGRNSLRRCGASLDSLVLSAASASLTGPSCVGTSASAKGPVVEAVVVPSGSWEYARQPVVASNRGALAEASAAPRAKASSGSSGALTGSDTTFSR